MVVGLKAVLSIYEKPKRFSSPVMRVVTDPCHLPASDIPKAKDMGSVMWMGRKQKRSSPSNNQGQSKAKGITITPKKACYCGGLFGFFFPPQHPTPEMATFQERWKRSSLLFVTSVCKAI